MELLIFCRQYYNGDSVKMGHFLDTDYERQILKIEAQIGWSYDQIMKEKRDKEDGYNSRPRPGDITQVHDDGWWDAKCLGPKSRMPMCFACVRILGVKPIKYLADRVTVDGRPILRSRNCIDWTPVAGVVYERTALNPGIYDKVADKPFVIPAGALDVRA